MIWNHSWSVKMKCLSLLYSCTLGARGFSCAVSGVAGYVSIVTRTKLAARISLVPRVVFLGRNFLIGSCNWANRIVVLSIRRCIVFLQKAFLWSGSCACTVLFSTDCLAQRIALVELYRGGLANASINKTLFMYLVQQESEECDTRVVVTCCATCVQM